MKTWCRISLLVLLVVGCLAAWVTVPATVSAKTKTLSITYGEPWKDLIEPAIADFEAATGVKVDATVLPAGTYVKKLTTDLAAGTATDIFMVDSFMIPAWAEAGYLYPLDSYLAKWPDWDQYYPGMKDIVAFGGKHYAVMIDTDVRMLWYWKPIFKKAGLPIPWKPKDWFDVFAAASTIKQKVPEVKAPLFIPMGPKWGEGTTMQGFYMLLLGADTPKGDRNRLRDWKTGKWIGSSPAIKDALTFYKLDFAGGFSPTEPHYAPAIWANWRRMMREGQIGIGLGGSWEWTEFWPKAKRPSPEERAKVLGWAPMPGSGKPGAPKIACVSGGWSLAINAKANHPDLAWKFFKILFTKERIGNWLASASKVAPRKDASEVPAYAQNDFLTKALKLMDYSSYRDTYPGYSKVSQYIQQATEKVAVKGMSVAKAMEWYKAKLIEEFGADKVEEIH